jgi:hypothetical protein
MLRAKAQLARDSEDGWQALKEGRHSVSDERDEERLELEAAGWRPEDRYGETVWQNSESGFWYSQRVAITILREGVEMDVPLNAEGGT